MIVLTRFKELIVESLKDNKKWIIGLYILFIVVFIVAWLLSANQANNLINNSAILRPNMSNPLSTSQVSAIDIFIINESSGILTYIFSVFFGIPAFVSLLYNGVNLGVVGQLFSALIPNGALRYIVYLIPHGIFEITALIIESVAGILLFRFIWNFIKAWRSDETQGISDSFEKNKKLLIQSIILMIFSTLLLLIAAPIEVYFSVPFSEFILGV